MIILGCAVALWFFMQNSPLKQSTSGTGETQAQEIIRNANAAKGMADHRNSEIEEMTQP